MFNIGIKGSGFTLLETVISVSLAALVIALSLPLYNNYQSISRLDQAGSESRQALRRARALARAGTNNAGHGVFFDFGSAPAITLYQGPSYAGRDTEHDERIVLGRAVTGTTTLSGSEVNFSPFASRPSASGQVFLSLDNLSSTTITVSADGLVSTQ